MLIIDSKVIGGGKRFFGHYSLSNVKCSGCSFDGGIFGYNGSWERGSQDSLTDALIDDADVRGCSVGPAIIRRSTFSDIRGDLLICWGVFFDQVKVLGRFDALMLNSSPEFGLSDRVVRRYQERRNEFYENVDWALDISQAEFSDFSMKSGAIPLSKMILDPETQFVVDFSEMANGVGDLPVSSYTKILISRTINERSDRFLLVAPKLDRDLFVNIMRDANILRGAGCIGSI